MKYLSWKLTVTILTFFIGTGLATIWFFVESKFFELPVILFPTESQIATANSENDFVATPDAAPKTMIFTESASLNGKRDAVRDIKKGKLIVWVRGNTFFQKLLEDDLAKYKVKVESIGCSFDKEDEIYLGGYNEVSKSAINERFGNGFIETAISKASQSEKEKINNR